MKFHPYALIGMSLMAFASQSHAVIQLATTAQSGTGESDIILVMADQGATGSQSTYVLDLGVLVNQFDPNRAYRYDLGVDPIYNEWISSRVSGTGQITFGLVGGKGTGQAPARYVLTTSANGIGNRLTNGLLSNNLGTLSSGFMQSTTNLTTRADRSAVANHRNENLTANPVIYGSSYETATSGASSFASFNTNWFSAWSGQMANVGSQVEFFRVTPSSITTSAAPTIVDFFSATESAGNLGGFWSITNNILSYTAAPAAPVPEASEWAMMLGGLGLVGLFARRRREQLQA